MGEALVWAETQHGTIKSSNSAFLALCISILRVRIIPLQRKNIKRKFGAA